MRIWVLSAALVAAGSGRAAADVPAWCKGAGDAKIDFNITNGNGEFKYNSAADDDKDIDALSDIVGALCTPGPENYTKGADAKKFHAQVEAARARWTKRFEMSDEDWADAAAWSASGIGDRRGLSFHADLQKKPWSSFGPVEQFAGVTRGAGMSGDAMLDHVYFADALGAKITQAGRLGYIVDCLGSNAGAVEWAMCQGDIDAFDLKALGAELRAAPGDGFSKMTIRIIGEDYAHQRIPAHAAKVKELIAKDPAYGKLFEVAAKARKEWDARWKTDAQLIDLISQLDDAHATNSRRAFEGCDETTWKAWQTAVAAIPAKTYTGMHDKLEDGVFMYPDAMAAILANPEGYLAGAAMALCHQGEPTSDALVRLVSGALMRWPGHRGPRGSAEVAMMKADVVLDDCDARLDFPGVHRDWFGGSGGSHSGGGAGSVSKIKITGKKVHVEFAGVPVKEDHCTKEVVTHRIERIEDNGTVLYERNCLSSKVVTVTHTPSPTDADIRYAAVLKPGMVATIMEGVLLVAWPSNGAKLPSILFGVPIK